MKLISTAFILTVIISMTFFITIMLSKKKKMSREKSTPFECGFMNLSSARKPFSIKFFLIATLFLIFDMEISIIIPMYSTKMVEMKEWMISSSFTITILILGLFHEWKNKMLEWSK